jgi:hypothetical protein
MATEYERPGDRVVDRSHMTDTGSGMGIVLGLLIAFGLMAILYFAFVDRTPPGSSATSTPPVSAPERTGPTTATPPASTPTPAVPSTK